jgi:hypothetical protein
MRHRKLLAGIAVGSLAALGGFGFNGPPDDRGPGEDAGPPDGMPEEAENGCNGIEEAQDRIGDQDHPVFDDHPAAEVLEAVEDLLTNGDGCNGNGD